MDRYADIRARRNQGKKQGKKKITRDSIKLQLYPLAWKEYIYTIDLWIRFDSSLQVSTRHRVVTSSSFNQEFGTTCTEEDPFDGAPDESDIQDFLVWFVRTRKGHLDNKVTQVTVYNRYDCFKRAIGLHTGYRYSSEEQESIRKVSRNL